MSRVKTVIFNNNKILISKLSNLVMIVTENNDYIVTENDDYIVIGG